MTSKSRIRDVSSITRCGLFAIAAITFFLPFVVHAEVYQYVTQWGSLGSVDGKFNYTYGVAVDSSGNVYVADTNNHRIQKFNASGTYATQWGTYGSGNSQFQYPRGVAVDSSGNVYVADTYNHRIQKFNASGTYVTQWGASGSGDGQFNNPYGVAVDSSGNVYVADKDNHRIQKIDSSGNFMIWGTLGTGDANFCFPQGVAVDSSGNVYVADTNNSRIQKFTSSGNFITKWGTQGVGDGQFASSYSPQGVAVDSSGNVYVADTNNNRIQKFTSSGNFITKWGTQGAGDGQFAPYSPFGVAVDSSGNIYVADTYNHRIQKFKPIFNLNVNKSGTGTGSVIVDTGTLTWNGNIGTASYDGGTSITLTATAAAGSEFTGWLGGGCSGTGACTTTPNGDTFVRAVFSGQTESVWAWGYNNYGQLGNAAYEDSNTPLQVSGLSNVIAIAGGDSHNVSLKSDGIVWTWGRNDRGQLGNGANTTSNTPVQVSGLSNVLAVAGAYSHTVALKSDGKVWAWGQNGVGQLGNDTIADSNTPVQVSGLSNVIAIAGGNLHTAALKSDGTVLTWGDNGFGQLGNGANTNSKTPIQVSGLSNVIAIAGGNFHTVALKSDGTVWTWGQNTYGQLGNGTYANSNMPVQVSGLSNVIAIAAGNAHTIALKSDGTVWTWGTNGSGQLGNSAVTNSKTPVQASGLSNVIAIAGGDSHTIALKSDGMVWAWGYNEFGQLGNGTNTSSNTPVHASGLRNVMAVAGGSFHTIALKSVNYSLTAQKAGNGLGTVTSVPSGITCGTDCVETYNVGTSVSLYATRDEPSGSVFSGWSGEGCSGTGTCTVTMDAARTVTATFTDTVPPSGGITINSGATYTKTPNVNLTISCTVVNDCVQMQFSDDNSNWSSPESFAGTKAYTLPSGDGTKTVYVQFKDAAENWSSAYFATITLDTVAPTVSIDGPSTPLTTGGPVTYTVTYTGADMVLMNGRVTLDKTGTANGTIEVSGPGKSSRTVTISGITGDGTLGISIAAGTAVDSAGNLAAAAGPSATFTVDNTAPAAAIGTPSSGLTKTGPVTYTVTYTGADTVTLANANVTLVRTGAANGTLTVTGTGNSSRTLTISDITGDGTLGISIAAGTASDAAGNLAAVPVPGATFAVDNTAPAGAVSINGGLLGTNSMNVTLSFSASDAGSGGIQIAFSNGGGTYTPWESYNPSAGTKSWTLPDGEGAKAVYVKFKDAAGNESAPYSYTIILETTAPVPVITLPVDESVLTTLDDIRGTVTDASPSGGLSKIELQVQKPVSAGIRYLTTSSTWVETPTFFIPNSGTVDSWVHYITSGTWENDTTYTITARATDQAGNVGTASAHFSICQFQPATSLSMDVSSQMILSNGTLSVAGKLTRLPDTGKSLNGLPINLIITDPDGISTTVNGITNSDAGHYLFENVGGFTKTGAYSLQAQFPSAGCLLGTTALAKSVNVGRSAGYAILVEGRISGQNPEGLNSHNKTANRIYQKLKERGFVDDNIMYFNYNTSQAGIVVDAAPTKAGIQDAVTTWAKGRMNAQNAPLYFIMVDHGMPGAFYINDTTITPQELADWLSTLEAGLIGQAVQEKIIVVIGSCYSGSFVPALSKQNRIIVASAAADEESYKGLMEDDGIRSGEYFLDEFFIQLGRGYSFKKSFEEATAKTREFTRQGGNTNSLNSYLDTSVQHPLMDDNGDGKGSNLLTQGMGDGQLSRAAYLGTGPTYDTNAAGNSAEVVDVTETKYLAYNTSSAALWLTSNVPFSKIGTAGFVVRPPTMMLSGSGSVQSNQLFLNLDTNFMSYDSGSGHWVSTYNNFTDSGMYEIFYFVKDSTTGEISPMKRSVVYRDYSGNTAPSLPTLVSPENNAETKTVVIFQWNPSADPDGVTYNLVIKDSNGTVIYKKEGIATTMTYVDGTAVLKDGTTGLKDGTTYFWQVEAVDSYGEFTPSPTRSFRTNNTNFIPGIIHGIVFSDQAAAKIAAAEVTATIGSYTKKITTGADGNFVLDVAPGDTVTIACVKGGYQTASITNVVVQAGSSTPVNIPLSVSARPGDLNGDSKVDLADVILALQVISGVHPFPAVSIHKEADVDGDGKIGMAEVIYIMQKIAVIR